MYRIEFAASAAREFRNLPYEAKNRVARAVDGLEQDPGPPGCAKLRGDFHLCGVRAGHDRIVCEVDDEAHLVRTIRIRYPREAYREAANEE